MSFMAMEMKFSDAALKKLESIPALLQFQVIDKAIPAMVRPILDKARAIAPRSTGGSRDKWSNSGNVTKNFNRAVWEKDESADHLGYRINKRSIFGAYVKVGAKSPKGNKQRFNQTKYVDRRVFYWGKEMGFRYKPPYRFMQRAYDETISQQMSAFTAAIQSFKLP